MGIFRERITTPIPASQSTANLVHVRMRDSFRNSLKMELFHVPITGSLTGAEHLIGVRDHTDFGDHISNEISCKRDGGRFTHAFPANADVVSPDNGSDSASAIIGSVTPANVASIPGSSSVSSEAEAFR